MEYPDNSILLVDDEKQVLYSLNRLLRPLRCKVFMAESAEVALDILEAHPIDIVITDMRMPEMGGEVFLSQVVKRWPDVERVVMTGFSDPGAIIDAINMGKVSRFMLKPWDEAEVLKMVEKAFLLVTERHRVSALQRLTREKNEQLKNLNRGLEQRVQQRTQQLRKMNDSLQSSYRSVVNMLSTLSIRRMGIKASKENQKYTRLMSEVAMACGVEGEELKQLMLAWQFRHIGKLSFPDEILQTPYLAMTPEQQKQFHTHPLLAQASCLPVRPLHGPGQVLRQHREYLDGSGYPSQAKGEEIGFLAQVLCVVNDYIELVSGHYALRPLGNVETMRYMQQTAVERYNQEVVAVLADVVEALSNLGEALNDTKVTSMELVPGMTLSRDLFSPSGILLLGAGQPLSDILIERIRDMEYNLDEYFEFFVHR